MKEDSYPTHDYPSLRTINAGKVHSGFLDMVASSKEINSIIPDGIVRKPLTTYPGERKTCAHRETAQKHSGSFICNNPILSHGE